MVLATLIPLPLEDRDLHVDIEQDNTRPRLLPKYVDRLLAVYSLMYGPLYGQMLLVELVCG